ncbi:pentatricopeptide repeat-containing protein At5g03800 [Rhodamnia argentea]|uniref:Pentatricopeptide repeat-containing protein At5g03800 n=1 Tax=Rhodamnia argentea TaxID=178133 RepID=A0A8B8PJE9_9MYRT|nr:pentatricopeptide repeat-containing protein At5g03800 [Rhodamnia argentea]
MAALIHPTTTTALPSPSLLPKLSSSSPPSSSLSLSKPKLLQSTATAAATATATQFLLPQPPPPPIPQPFLSGSRRLFPSQPFNGPSPAGPADSLADGCFDLLRFSVSYGDVDLARAVHALVLKLEENPSLGNALIVAYLKLGRISDAYSVFDGLSHPNVVSYTAVVSGLAKAGRGLEAVEVFFRLISSGIQPNEYSFVAILTACIRLTELELGLQVHALVAKTGYLESVFVSNALMGMYSKCECLDSVLELFDEMPNRDIASWNTVVSGLVKAQMYQRAFESIRQMDQNDVFRVDYMTLSALLTACTDTSSLIRGKEIHAHAIRIGMETDLSVNNALMGFYTKCGTIDDVEALFEKMAMRDVITWTEMIRAYADFGLIDMAMEMFHTMPEKNCVSRNALLAGLCENGKAFEVLDLFISMLEEGLELTDYTLTTVAKACGLLGAGKLSEQLQGFIVKFGLLENACAEAALLDMCTRCGRMVDAGKMFKRWPFKWDSSIICTSMICGYARNGLPDEAMSLFCRCQAGGSINLDEAASTSILGVCGTLGSHKMGEQIHCHVLKSGLFSDLEVANALTGMYSKCWNMDSAKKVFNIMPAHDVVSWNSLIAGFVLHRQGDDALTVWSNLRDAGIKPDKISILLVILAYKYTKMCLVDECHGFFSSMRKEFDIEPSQEHYAAFVGVLGIWGFLELAEKTISNMPFEPEALVWRALLDGCRIHSNAVLGKTVMKHIVSMEPRDPSTYVLVANLYSASGRGHCSETVRKEMRLKGFRKQPSRSWVIHQNKTISFYTRDKSHLQAKDIYSGLEILISECQRAGYVPDTSYVLHEVGEHQKKDFLFYHSAKLAAAFGLLMNRPGKPIKIVKNISLCEDCHQFLKYTSAITNRQIVLRDASGFHYFSSGHCSCNDRW